MEKTTANSPSSTPPSFAGLLASLAAPTPKTAWNNDDLADDVATLSYETALRAHGRYKADDAVIPAMTAEDGAGRIATNQTPEGAESGGKRTASLWSAPRWSEGAETGIAPDPLTSVEASKKCASITIRMSKTECDQLRRRAAQAGLTVSAYLRSCTFEAEALRAQVKEALAELRQSASIAEEKRTASGNRRWSEWMVSLMPRRQRGRSMAQA